MNLNQVNLSDLRQRLISFRKSNNTSQEDFAKLLKEQQGVPVKKYIKLERKGVIDGDSTDIIEKLLRVVPITMVEEAAPVIPQVKTKTPLVKVTNPKQLTKGTLIENPIFNKAIGAVSSAERRESPKILVARNTTNTALLPKLVSPKSNQTNSTVVTIKEGQMLIWLPGDKSYTMLNIGTQVANNK